MAATPRTLLLPALLVLVAGLFAYHGTWNNAFLFDDLPAIRDNLALTAGDWWGAAFAEGHHPLGNRPFSCLTIALDFAVFGEGPFGPHLTNLLLHLVNALLVLVTVRRVLTSGNLAGLWSRPAATSLATAVATLWVAHPLGADAVAYATQRSTLLFSAALLLALHATSRANESPHGQAWRTLAVVAVAIGMASKEDMVVAPFLVLLFERAFAAASWRAVFARIGWLAALASTWIVLAACVYEGPVNPTVGSHTPYSAWQWLTTQAGVLVHYLRLVICPWPLRGAYDWGVVGLESAVLPGLLVLALLAAAVRCWWSRPWLGWLGASFFLLLAPTSTVLPIETEILAERRMYLPMLALLVPLVLAARHLLAAKGPRHAGFVVAATATLGLGLLTRDRVAVYANEAAFWGDAYTKREPGRRTFLAAQILTNQGSMLWQQRRFDEAHACYEEAMQCPTPTAVEVMHYAVSLCHRGNRDEGLRLLRNTAEAAPDNGDVLGSLGTCLLTSHYANGEPPHDPIVGEAEAALRRAVELTPKNGAYWNSLAYALRSRNAFAEAERAYAKACALAPDHVEPFFYRAEMLARLGREAEVQPMFEELLRARPADVPLRVRLAEIDLAARNVDSARRRLQDALRIEPRNSAALDLARRLDQRR